MKQLKSKIYNLLKKYYRAIQKRNKLKGKYKFENLLYGDKNPWRFC